MRSDSDSMYSNPVWRKKHLSEMKTISARVWGVLGGGRGFSPRHGGGGGRRFSPRRWRSKGWWKRRLSPRRWRRWGKGALLSSFHKIPKHNDVIVFKRPKKTPNTIRIRRFLVGPHSSAPSLKEVASYLWPLRPSRCLRPLRPSSRRSPPPSSSRGKRRRSAFSP